MRKGKIYELEVASLVQKLLDEGDLGINPEQAIIKRKPAYYSRDRGKNIIFDVSIEVCRRGASEPYWIWIWECKNYSHTVPVDDIEEFHSKLDQVGSGRTKGTIITPIGFDESTYEYARSKGIGLWRWISKNSPVIHLEHPVYPNFESLLKNTTVLYQNGWDIDSNPLSEKNIVLGMTKEITPNPVFPDSEFIYGLTTDGQLTTKLSELISLEFMDAQSNRSSSP